MALSWANLTVSGCRVAHYLMFRIISTAKLRCAPTVHIEGSLVRTNASWYSATRSFSALKLRIQPGLVNTVMGMMRDYGCLVAQQAIRAVAGTGPDVLRKHTRACNQDLGDGWRQRPVPAIGKVRARSALVKMGKVEAVLYLTASEADQRWATRACGPLLPLE